MLANMSLKTINRLKRHAQDFAQLQRQTKATKHKVPHGDSQYTGRWILGFYSALTRMGSSKKNDRC